jgi:DNA repair exonuclease SbcCD nuclease subunit
MTKPFEFLVFSDFHAHNFPYGATRTTIPGMGGLYNSRLADSAAVLDEMLEYAKQHDIYTVVFCGDLFHRRTSVATDVRHVIVDRLHRFADEDIELFMIPGNHDMGDRKGNVHSLVGLGELSDYIHVYDKISTVSPARSDGHDFEGVGFVFVPYTDSLEEAKSSLKAAGDLASLYDNQILFAHLGMQGATVGSDYVLINESDITVPDVPHDKFAACFFGHFHEHQQLFANGWFVGATHQHNWGDAYGSRGYLHVKVKKGKVEFEQIRTMAPEFVTTRDGKSSRGEDSIMKKNDFVKNITKDKYLDREELRVKWELDNAPEIVIDTEEEDTEFSLDTTQLSPTAVVDKWVESKLPEGLDKDEVLSVGKDILKEVGL